MCIICKDIDIMCIHIYCVYIHMCTHVHIYVHIKIYTHICIYTHMCIHIISISVHIIHIYIVLYNTI